MKFWTLLILALSANAARANTSAFESLEKIRSKYGDRVLTGIVELTGTKGQPQPEDWWLLSYDPKGPFKLHYYWADDSRATDEGFDDDVYRKGAPAGFIRFEKLKIDSTDVFRRANQEAVKTGVDFDRIDYRLRCREFSDEPIWSLKLYNRGSYVGKLDFSGGDGRLLRSVWLRYQGSRLRSSVTLTDSAFPGSSPQVSPVEPPSSSPDPSPPATGPSPPSPTKPSEEYPAATLVEGRPGYVRSPFDPDAGLIDVRGLKSGTRAHCPYTGKIFRIP